MLCSLMEYSVLYYDNYYKFALIVKIDKEFVTHTLFKVLASDFIKSEITESFYGIDINYSIASLNNPYTFSNPYSKFENLFQKSS